MKDYLGTTVKVGDRVAFSDSGRGGSVHIGEVIRITSCSWLLGNSDLDILDERSSRINKRPSAYVLVLPKGVF